MLYPPTQDTYRRILAWCIMQLGFEAVQPQSYSLPGPPKHVESKPSIVVGPSLLSFGG